MLEDSHLDRPSILGPTVNTALVAGVVFALPVLVGRTGPAGCCLFSCCTGLTGMLLGALPPLLYRRRGGWMRAGTGFLCGLLAVGTGAIVGAIVVHMLAPIDAEETRRSFEEAYRTMPPDVRSQVTEEEFVALSDWASYWPVFSILMWSFWAGIAGMITAGLVRPPPPPPAPLEQPWQHS